eukprot:TRINITY_DN70674_c0_g1_i1.p1 TRINITY_DN70674_c0_g1~~TRINITY_DN70674_c0_g1_i1.p1  ORF type:complete len:416 (-),score=33.33 TRINITY_DN70674_c0_g1_i1:43-1290(-)
MGACSCRGRTIAAVASDRVGKRAYDDYSTIPAPAKVFSVIKWHFVFHSVAVWFGLPLLVLLQALVPAIRPQCASGWNPLPLIGLLFLIAHHFHAESKTWENIKSLLTPMEITVMRQRGVFKGRRQLMLFAMSLHLGIYFTFIFPLWAASCGDIGMESWLRSWKVVPMVGEWLVGPLRTLGFPGILLISIALRWLPEVISLLYMMLSGRVSHIFDDGQRVRGSKFAELVVFAGTALMPSVSRLLEEVSDQRKWCFSERKHEARSASGDSEGAIEAEQKRINVTLQRESAASLEDFDLILHAHRRETEMEIYVAAMSQLLLRILFGCLVQLWVQSAVLMYLFTVLDMEGRCKVVLGIALSTVELLVGVWNTCCGRKSFGLVGLLYGISAVFGAWCVARVYYAFMCAEHVWNLTTGCV